MAITKAEKHFGYFALLSNEIKDRIKALDICRTKELINDAPAAVESDLI